MDDGVRAAQASDDHAIGELLVSAFEQTYARMLPEVKVTAARRADLRDVKRKREVAQIWVYVRRAQVVGTVALWPWGAAGSEAWIPGACDLRQVEQVASNCQC